jgi:hypothetical protein
VGLEASWPHSSGDQAHRQAFWEQTHPCFGNISLQKYKSSWQTRFANRTRKSHLISPERLWVFFLIMLGAHVRKALTAAAKYAMLLAMNRDCGKIPAIGDP